MTDLSPAEKRAADENLPVVLLAPLEALRVAAGNPLIARTVGGDEVLVRLLTVDEAMAAAERGGQWHRDRGLECPPVAPREVFERICAPVNVEDYVGDAATTIAGLREALDEVTRQANARSDELDEVYAERAELHDELARYRTMHDAIAEALAQANGTTLRREGASSAD